MSEQELSPKQAFDASLRGALALALSDAARTGLARTLPAQDRQSLLLHAKLLGWMAPQRLIQLHEAAAIAAHGDAEAFDAMALLAQECYCLAELAENAPLADALKAGVLHPCIMEGVETAAATLSKQLQLRLQPAGSMSGRRAAFVVSSLTPGAATTFVMRALAGDLATMGWHVEIYQSLLLDARAEGVAQELSALGVDLLCPPRGTDLRSRTAWIAQRLAAHPVDAVIHYVWPNDFVGKLLCNLRCAPLQVYINHTCDQPTGDFDIKIGYSGDYRGHHQAQRYVTLPNCSVRGEQARQAPAFDRSSWGLMADAVCLATFSRLSKCVDATFLEGMCRILIANPHAVWLLVGERSSTSEAQINAWLEQAGVMHQVLYTGFMHGDDYFGLLKAVDIYCDTIAWMGGQTVADAVICGLPVVCCAPGQPTVLAPNGNAPTALASQLLAPGSLVAATGNAEDYARVAQAYIDDPALRRQAGELNARSADPDAWPKYMRQFDYLLRHALAMKQSAQTVDSHTA